MKRQFVTRSRGRGRRGRVEGGAAQEQEEDQAWTMSWSDREGEIFRWRNEERREGGGSKSFCGFATQADRKIRNEWRSDTMQRLQADREIPLSAPGIGNPPALPSPPSSPRHSNHSPRIEKKNRGGGRGAKKGRQESEKKRRSRSI